MKKLIFSFVLTFLLSAGLLQSQELSGISGSFNDLGFGARAAGMGGAFAGLANDAHSVLWNPAGLAYTERKMAAFSFTNQLGLVKYQVFSYAMPFSGAIDGLGAAVIVAGDEALKEMTFQAGASKRIYGFTVGMNLKYRHASFGNNSLSSYEIFEPDEISEGMLNQIHGSANGFGFDVGVLYDLSPQIRIGAMLKDIYSPVMWDSKTDNTTRKAKGSYTETIPFESVIGTMYNLVDSVLIMTADYTPQLTKDQTNIIRGGAELKLWKIFAIRAGLQNFVNNETDEKYTFGIGMKIGMFKGKLGFDYTHMVEALANTSRFSLSFEF